jgi:hypothetical protein
MGLYMGDVRSSLGAPGWFRRAPIRLASVLACVVLLASACDVSATLVRLSTACGSWRTVPSPSVGIGFNSLDGVAVAPDGRVWAVGAYKDATGVGRSLTLSYDGTSWTRVPSPDVGARGTFLNDVDVIGSDDAWAVGATRNERGIARTYAIHWNGRAWASVPTPNLGGGDNFLTDVASVGSDDVWAAGYRHHGSSTRSMLLHWDGKAWSSLAFHLQRSAGDGLNAISASPGGDVWAVGGFVRQGLSTQTLILHWNGNDWHSVPSPNVSVHGNSLTGVVGTAGSGAWAVGGFQDFRGDRTLFMNSVSGSWDLHQMPDSNAVSDDLNDVAAASSRDLWAVGTSYDGQADHTLIMRGNGSSWYRVPSPDAGVSGSRLSAVATGSGGNAWAVGTYSGGYPGRTLIQHFCPIGS